MIKKISVLLAVIAVAVIISSNSSSTAGYKAGDKAIDFKLKNVDDKLVSLSNFEGAKGFIVVFTCNHCPFSVKYEDRIIKLNQKYASQGYPVIAINPNNETAYPDDSFENMKIRAKEKGFTFPYLRDESQEIAKTYGALKTPHIYILRKAGTDLLVEYIGAIDDNTEEADVSEKFAENALNALLANKSIAKKETRAVGCGIKWK